MQMILLFGGGLVIFLVVVGIVITARSERSLVEERLGQYLEDDAELSAQRGRGKATPVGDWLDQRLEKTRVGGGISRELARADLKLKSGEFIGVMIISIIGMAFIVGFINNPDDPLNLFTLVGGVIGFFIPWYYVRRLQNRRLIRFSDQLADMLNLMVNGLRAGYSTMQAMESVSKELPAPIGDEFRRVVQEISLGLPMEVALDNILRRIPSEDLDLVITAMNVQREVGGNLAEILDTISYTIRERVRIKGEIRVLTSQVMYSARFLALLPLIIAAILWFLNRDYMMEFFNPATRIPGIIAMVIAAIMITSGYFIMNKIGNVEV
jgi:tight adherence protein B